MASSTPGPGQTRLVYTESLKISLMKLCVFHCEQYLDQTESEVKFWFDIRDEFASIANIPRPDRTKLNAGNNLRVKVKEITEARQKQLDLHGFGTSGIGGSSAGNSELDQITDQWLEIVSRKQTEKEQKTLKVKDEVEKEQRHRQEARNRLTQNLSQREDVKQVESVLRGDNQLPVREKRRKIGTARAQVKRRALDQEDSDSELRESLLKSSEQVQETLQAVQRMLNQSVQPPASLPPSSSMPSGSPISIPSTSSIPSMSSLPSASMSSTPMSSASMPSAFMSSASTSSISMPSISSMPSASSVPTREEFDQLSAKVIAIEEQLLEIQSMLESNWR